MKFTTKQSDLSKSLDQVAPLASGMEILKNILMEVRDDHVDLTGGNENMFLTLSVACETLEEGEVAVSSATLKNYVGNLPAGAVTVSKKDAGNTVVETSSGASATLSGISVSDYPMRPKVKYDGVELPMESLQSLIDWVIFAAANEDVQPPTIGGVNMVVAEDGVTLMATDRFRLARASFKLPEITEASYNAILRPKFLSIARRIFRKDGAVNIGMSDGKSWLGFKQERNELLNLLVGGDYPDVGKLIPSVSSTTAIVDRHSLIQVIQRVVVFANTETHSIHVGVSDGKIRFGVQSSGVGTAKDHVVAEVSGDPVELYMNGKYLLDILNRAPGDKILMGFTGPLKAILIQPAPGVLTPGWKLDYVLMPLRGDM